MKRTLLTLLLVIVFFFSFGITPHGVALKLENPADLFEVSKKEKEILWLARAIYSETKVPSEQTLIAWVVRNRVESKYRGDTYEEVVLARGQFSGLHPSDEQYIFNTTLSLEDYDKKGQAWRSAVDIARAVYDADANLRPISKEVRHFYSPQSLVLAPKWSHDLDPIQTITNTKNGKIRFQFYESVR